MGRPIEVRQVLTQALITSDAAAAFPSNAAGNQLRAVARLDSALKHLVLPRRGVLRVDRALNTKGSDHGWGNHHVGADAALVNEVFPRLTNFNPDVGYMA